MAKKKVILKKDKVIRVAIAGQGRSGYTIHYGRGAGQWPKLFEVVAVADQLPERRKQAETEMGARTYADYKELIKDGDYDLFVNALPSVLHTRATIEALNAGHHVLCEKPIAGSVKDFDKMVAAARKNRRIFQPFQNSRFLPCFRKALEVAQSGILGQIVHVRLSWSGFSRRWDWQTFQANMGGNLFNTGPHPVDHAIMFFGEKKKPEVFCRMACHNAFGGDAEDFCALTLYGNRQKDPLVEVLLSNYLAFPQGDRYSISGTFGGLAGGPAGLKWKYFAPGKTPRQKQWPKWSLERKYCSENLPWVEKSWTPPKEAVADVFKFMVRAFYKNLHEVLTGAGKPEVKISQVRKQIAVIEKCQRQNRLPKKRANPCV